MVSAPQRRVGAIFLKDRGLSERRACFFACLSRSSFQYRSRRFRDTGLEERLREIARKYPRYGYRRAWALERRSGRLVNHKKVWRVWRSLGLSLPRRHLRKRRLSKGAVPMRAAHPNHVWTYDFMHDWTLEGRSLKILTVADEFTREGLSIKVRRKMPSKNVLEVLERLFQEHGAPEYLRSDNGPEFIAKAVQVWLGQRGTKTLFIEPGCPWQNAYGESFNGRLRDECLNTELFRDEIEGQVVAEDWRRYYNEERPHSSLGYATPAEFHAAWLARAKEAGSLVKKQGVETRRLTF
jgi:putative transposase